MTTRPRLTHPKTIPTTEGPYSVSRLYRAHEFKGWVIQKPSKEFLQVRTIGEFRALDLPPEVKELVSL